MHLEDQPISLAEIQTILQQAGLPALQGVDPIRAEASSRRYYRLFLQNQENIILCAGLPMPYTDQDGFLELSEFFARFGLPVPRVLAHMSSQAVLLLEDIGSYDLSGILNRLDPEIHSEQRLALFNASLDLLIQLQTLEAPALVQTRLFDEEKLSFEMHFLFQALLQVSNKLEIENPASFEMQDFLLHICKKLEQKEHFVLCHRDYHARNLLLKSESSTRLGMIDYQDARMGLPFYDLASLLYDPYTPLVHSERHYLYQRFSEASALNLPNSLGVFYMVALQRVMKALGTYLYQISSNQHSVYIESVGLALNNLEDIIQRAHFPDHLYVFVQNCRRQIQPELKQLITQNTGEAST